MFDNYAVNVPVGDRNVTLNLFDTAGIPIYHILFPILCVGQEDYDRLRPLSYSNASVFLVCFSITSKSSLENAEDKWVPELRKYAPSVPFILVGTQADRRQNGSPRFVTQKEGIAMAKKLGAAEYVECSAKTRDGLRDVFVAAIMTAINKPNVNGASGSKKGSKNDGSAKKKRCLIG